MATPWSLDRRGALRLLLVLVAGWLPVLVGADAIRGAASLHALGSSGNPYWAPAHAALLYVAAPVVFGSACLLLLSPGLLLALRFGTSRHLGDWLLHGFAISVVLVSVAAIIPQAMGISLTGTSFALLVIACAVAAFVLLLHRLTSVVPLAAPRVDVGSIVSLVVPMLLLAAVLAPKIFWENFNGDGAHAFESSRLLLRQPLPFWDPAAGAIASWPGLTSAVFFYPLSWFVRLFGEFEASVRLPFLFFLAVLHGAIVSVATEGRERAFGVPERLLVWLALAVYAVVMSYSASYEAYAADMALPASQDTLQIIFLLGFVLTFLRQQRGWMLLFALLTFWCSPGGPLLVGLWLIAVAATWRPVPVRRLLESGGVVVGLVVLTAATAWMLSAVGEAPPGEEHGLRSLVSRFRFIQLTDLRRLAFLVVPGGIVPALALLAWKRQDGAARAVTVLAVFYFAMFFVQAFISLHQFAPAMVLPIVVLWRLDVWETAWRRPALLATAAAGVAALALSLPSDFRIHTQSREVGSLIEDRIGGYEAGEPAAFRRMQMFSHLFPLGWDARVPAQAFGGSPIVFGYYAHAANGGGTPRQPNYVLLPSDAPAPAGHTLVRQEGGSALYVRSDSLWKAQQMMKPPIATGNRLYALSKGTMYGNYGGGGGARVLDLRRVPSWLSSLVGG